MISMIKILVIVLLNSLSTFTKIVYLVFTLN